MSAFSVFTLPVITINNYLWSVMKEVDSSLEKTYKSQTPFFPISDSATGTKSWENKPYFIYDRILKMTGSPFYPIKKEHILYALKANDINTLEWGMALQYILDRMDDAAQDINEWNRSQNSQTSVYFHHLRVFQNSESNIRDFSNRPYYITQFIVEAEYHFTDSIESILA
mgnify:CR=1 FL=1